VAYPHSSLLLCCRVGRALFLVTQLYDVARLDSTSMDIVVVIPTRAACAPRRRLRRSVFLLAIFLFRFLDF